MEAGGVIHCIGDSHASFFSGYDKIQPEYPEKSKNKFPFFICYRLGAVLAYSLCRLGTKERGREKLLDLTGKLPFGASLMLCFGEIDCRFHLLKQAETQQKKIEEVVCDCVQKYTGTIEELKNKGFNILIWNAIPSSTESNNPEYPSFGTLHERNSVTQLFNSMLKEYADKNALPFISIFDFLTDNKLQTNKKYFFDGVHLGQLAMPVVLKEIKKIPCYSQFLSNFSGLRLLLLNVRVQFIYQYLYFKRKITTSLKYF